MALVFDNISNEPQTHIFIIGIGGYPYLKDGATPAPLPNDLKNLGQLTSPPVSAEALYNTAIELHNNNSWITPLGSIEVLVSPSPGGIPVFTGINNIEPATHENIDKSYAAWKTRCDSSVDNVAIFYFCGHGLGKGLDQFLLVEDFGKNANSPWTDAISFDDSRIAFYSCKAKTQLFFVDACREVTNTMLLYNVKGAQLETPPYVTSDCKYYLNMKAAATNEKAYGKRNKPSFFTKALINGLKGQVARNNNNYWTVSTGEISSKINELLRMIDPALDYPQRCNSAINDTTEIIRLNNAPTVSLEVSCNPDDALPLATLSYRHTGAPLSGNRPPEPQPWQLNVEAGIYELQAVFTDPPYRNNTLWASAFPPSSTAKINCQ